MSNNPFDNPVIVPVAPGIQLTFPMSRSTDHISSYEAADKMVKSGKIAKQHGDVLNILKIYLRQHNNDPPTSKQLAAFCKDTWPQYDRYVMARRLSDLYHLGMVEKIEGQGELKWKAS